MIYSSSAHMGHLQRLLSDIRAMGADACPQIGTRGRTACVSFSCCTRSTSPRRGSCADSSSSFWPSQSMISWRGTCSFPLWSENASRRALEESSDSVGSPGQGSGPTEPPAMGTLCLQVGGRCWAKDALQTPRALQLATEHPRLCSGQRRGLGSVSTQLSSFQESAMKQEAINTPQLSSLSCWLEAAASEG